MGVGIRCLGVFSGHDGPAEAELYAVGPPPGRRAFLCDRCATGLADIGIRVAPVDMVERGADRRAGLGRRSRDNRAANPPLDRRAP